MSALYKKHFWDWFKRHHHEYDYDLSKTKSKKEIAYFMYELSAHLRAYNRFCGFSLDWEQKMSVLTITVSGIAKHFKKAEQLVKTAPMIHGWTFKALEDPRPIDFAIEHQIEKTGIDPREFYFEYSSLNPENTGLIIYHPLTVKDNQHMVSELASVAVYNLLGERSYGCDIHCLEVANLSSANREDIEKLEALPASLSSLKSDMLIDDKGNLVMRQVTL